MSPRVGLVPVRYETLQRIHRRTARSTFWELDPLYDDSAATLPEVDKAAWLAGRAMWQGTAGFSIAETGSEVGALATVLFCPASDAPGSIRLPSAPVSRGAWVVTSLHIDAQARFRGWESVLLDAAVMAATRLGAPCLEAFALRPEAPGGLPSYAQEAGLVEVDLVESAGFEVVHEHPAVPRLRLELPPEHDLMSAAEVSELLATTR